ncbi:hypothetical protein ACLIYP_05625 [Streptomyces nanhaiensis]|uniref:hypothetical protein n=1 Tax=Streptomyces nanhaiensis TaxID=679319 RepID=UPI00399C9F83
MGFPEDPLPVRAELDLGDGWEDITPWWDSERLIQLGRGARGEASQMVPSTCTLTLRNTDGRFTPRNPVGPYYGRIGRNTPLRVSVDGPEAYLAHTGDTSGYAHAPAATTSAVTTELDVRVEATYGWNTSGPSQVLVSQWQGTERSWLLGVTSGALRIQWMESSGSTAYWYGAWRLPEMPDRAAVRATVAVDTGAGTATVTLYRADSITGPWTQIETPITFSGPTLPIYIGSAPVQTSGVEPGTTPAWDPLDGRVHAVEIRSSIDGPIVADADFTAQTPGTTAFTDGAGVAWTVTAPAEITNRYTRFVGEVSTWPTTWGPSGQDAETTITASGILRRLSQGAKALDSTLRRRIPSFDPIAYWPLEEDRDATQAYSPIPGARPMRVSGDVQFAADDTLPGSHALPRLNTGASLTARVPAAPAGSWHVEMVFNTDTAPTDTAYLLTVHTAGGTYARYEVRARLFEGVTPQVLVYGFDTEENRTTLVNEIMEVFGYWNRLQLFASTSGSTTTMTVRRITIGETSEEGTAVWTGSAGRVSRVSINVTEPLDGIRIGHLAVFSQPGVFAYNFADHGFDAEFAAGRIVRLCDEEGVPVRIMGVTSGTEPMGPQRPGRLLDLLEECAQADGGLLAEDPERLGLIYRTRTSVYNQPVTLALRYGQEREVQPPLEPVDDDLSVRNDVTRTRPGGSSARAVLESGPLSVQPPPAGVGVYDDSLTVNVATDEQLPPIAGWDLHLHTWDEARYPRINLDLGRAPHLIPAVLDLALRDRATITGAPAQWAPGTIDQLVQGWSEALGVRTWSMQLACAPAGPWAVGVLEDPVLGRADTDGSVLVDEAGPDDTVLYVTTTQGPPWVTDPAEFPFDLRVGGEVVTATACTTGEAAPMRAAAANSVAGGASTSHVAPSVDAAGAGLLVCLWQPWNTLTSYTLPGGMALGAETTGTYTRTADATEALAAAGATGTRTATVGAADAWAAITVTATGAPVIAEHLSGVSGAATTVALTTSADTEPGWWLLAMQGCDDSTMPLAMPDGWTLLATSGTSGSSHPITAAWAKRATGGAEQVEFAPGSGVDNHARLYVVSGAADLTAQAMTVTRSVNGVTKAHTAGTDVRLAQPAIIAL